MDRILTSTSFIPTPNKRYEISIQKLKNDNLVFIWNGNSLAIPFDDYQEGKFSLLAQAGIQSNNSGVIRFYYLRARNYAQTEPLVNIGKEEKRNLFLK